MPDQQTVAAFLDNGAAYGEPDAEVVRMETHAAVIFLVGRRAYKMKRQVRFSFLDFSTLEQRRAALAAELRLNLRTAPAIYRGLVPVVASGQGRLALGGDGEVVEWLLEMTRFAQSDLLANRAAAGELDSGLVDELAGVIADHHKRATVKKRGGGYDAMAKVIAGNATDLRTMDDVLGDVRALIEGADEALADCREHLEQRRSNGYVRHCHGDLHLGNIVLLEGRPVLFDCLEFDAALATIDTFYDLAFLLTDLWARGLTASANRLLNGYLEATLDDGGVGLLPLFMSVRAAIRAKVEGFSSKVEKNTAVRSRHLSEARRFVQLASRFLGGERARLIAIGGVSGTGKSTVARSLAPETGPAPGAVILRSDVVRKRLSGVDPTAPLPAAAYGAARSRVVYDTLIARANGLLAAGHAVIVDATWLDSGARAGLVSAARSAGVAFDGIWLHGSRDMLAGRIERRSFDVSDASVDVLTQQLACAEVPAAWTAVNADGSRGQVLATVRSAVFDTAM